MKFAEFEDTQGRGIAVETDNGTFFGLFNSDKNFPGTLTELIRKGGSALIEAAQELSRGKEIDFARANFCIPIEATGKIICVGVNYRDHAAESSLKIPSFPELFGRFGTSLLPHNAPIILPRESDKLDFEGELVVVIGKPGRRISKKDALDHVAGYSIFNDGSIRDYQLQTSQWTMGKNFDRTGAFGPFLVTPENLPPGAHGLKLETRLNGEVMQRASTADFIFDVPSLITLISQGISLEAGDVIVTGTPSGVGAGRKPPIYMKSGDTCEVEIEGIGILVNTIAAD